MNFEITSETRTEYAVSFNGGFPDAHFGTEEEAFAYIDKGADGEITVMGVARTRDRYSVLRRTVVTSAWEEVVPV